MANAGALRRSSVLGLAMAGCGPAVALDEAEDAEFGADPDDDEPEAPPPDPAPEPENLGNFPEPAITLGNRCD